MSAFRVGQKVVCVPRKTGLPGTADKTGANLPVKGQVYTVRDIVFELTGLELLLLVEVVNKPQRGLEPGFASFHFRPVAYPPQSLEHDAETFRKIAAQLPAPSKESVE